MKIVFKKTMKASEDGINSKLFEENIEYDVKDDLAESLIKGNLAIKYEEKKASDKILPSSKTLEEKAVLNYENKMLNLDSEKVENKTMISEPKTSKKKMKKSKIKKKKG